MHTIECQADAKREAKIVFQTEVSLLNGMIKIVKTLKQWMF